MVSMKDIAKACGVSVATVSKALSGQPDIGEQTRELICKTADSLGYMTNSAARALKTNRTYNIGVLFVTSGAAALPMSIFLRCWKASRLRPRPAAMTSRSSTATSARRPQHIYSTASTGGWTGS